MARSGGRSSITSAVLQARQRESGSDEPPDLLPKPAPDPPASPHASRRIIPDIRIENLLWSHGVDLIAGVDEAGRGAWAGPVVAAAVVLPKPLSSNMVGRQSWRRRQNGPAEWQRLLAAGIRDSKQLTPTQRAAAAQVIRSVAEAVGVGVVPATVLDHMGLSFTGQLALWRAVRALPIRPQYVLVDGFPLWSPGYRHMAVLQGDGRSLSIAAASIIAKVTRDAIMAELDAIVPGYGFIHNCGYGTREHASALQRLGACPHHRRSYQPVAAFERARDDAGRGDESLWLSALSSNRDSIPLEPSHA